MFLGVVFLFVRWIKEFFFVELRGVGVRTKFRVKLVFGIRWVVKILVFIDYFDFVLFI